MSANIPYGEPVEPALKSSRQGNPEYCVYPEERAQWALSQCKTVGVSSVERDIHGCRNADGKGVFTIALEFRIKVEELIYPGGPNDREWPTGKWIYAFRDKQLVAHACAAADGCWKGTSESGKSKKSWTCRGALPLDPGPEGNRYVYWFFLSPVELTQSTLDYLVQHRDFTRLAVSCPADAWNKTVLVPDPFHWAAAAHRLYYQPLVAKYLDLLAGAEPVAQSFIASVLKRWVDDGDQAKVKKYLKDGEPHAWLEKREKDLKELKARAEAAVAYLAYCVDSPEHHAVELACMEHGGSALDLCLAEWACLGPDLSVTEAGKELVRAVAANSKRFLRKYIFFDEPGPPKLTFKEGRWTWMAAVSIFEKFAPGFASVMARKGEQSLLGLEKKMVNYLKNVGIPTKKGLLKGLSSSEKRAYRAMASGKALDPSHGGFKKLLRRTGMEATAPERYFGAAAAAEKVHKNFELSFERLTASVDAAVQIANLVLVIEEYKDKKERGEHVSWVSVLGAGADATQAVTTCIGELVVEEARRQTLKRIASIAGMISSAVDSMEFQEQYHEALVGERDYGKAAGRGMQALGATAVGLSSAITLAATVFTGSALTGIGLIVGAAGAVLIIGGALVVHYFSLNPNQQFARGCFLSKDTEPVTLHWSKFVLPTDSSVHEAQALSQLLANFRIVGSAGDYPPWQVRIEAGLLYDQSTFKVHVRRTWQKPGDALLAQLWKRLADPPTARDYIFTVDRNGVHRTWGYELKNCELDGSGQGGFVGFCIGLEEPSEEWRPLNVPGGPAYKVEVTVQLSLDQQESLIVPPDKAVRMVLPDHSEVSSIDESNWVPPLEREQARIGPVSPSVRRLSEEPE